MVWLDTEHIVVCGFNKTSVRTLSVYSTSDLSTPMSVISLSVSPAILMPTFDPDVNLLYVSGKVSVCSEIYHKFILNLQDLLFIYFYNGLQYIMYVHVGYPRQGISKLLQC